jgi:hypothetical protein
MLILPDYLNWECNPATMISLVLLLVYPHWRLAGMKKNADVIQQ